MDAATAAAMSDPELNRFFRRRWSEGDRLPETTKRAAVPDLEDLGTELLIEWREGRVGSEGGGS